MRFSCPRCETWQTPQPILVEEGGGETSCRQCGALLALHPKPGDDAGWTVQELEDAPVVLGGEDPLRAFLEGADDLPQNRRADHLTGGRAQLLSLTVAWSPRLWLPCAGLLAVGLGLGVGLIMVGHRVDRSLALLFVAPALGLVAWSLVLAASAVANLLQVRLKGTAVGMGRSLRMILEHGNGAVGSALRYVVLGVFGSLVLGLLTLLGALPGLSGPTGVAITGLLLWLQVLAAAGAISTLLVMLLALLLHPGLAATGAQDPGRVFRFVWHLLRRQAPEVVSRAALPLGATLLLGLGGHQLLRSAFELVFSLNHKILGARFNDLLAASPVRFLLGAPELLDPGTVLSTGGAFVALSIVLLLALLLGFIASFAGVSGLLLCHGLNLPDQLDRSGPERKL
jgi:hypothetical protein